MTFQVGYQGCIGNLLNGEEIEGVSLWQELALFDAPFNFAGSDRF